jgi:hypothetical protein
VISLAILRVKDKNGNIIDIPAIKGKDGVDGHTPVKGTDYFTEADKTEIMAMVIESLGGNPVFGYVDKNNNIIVSGNLADGSYNVKYEMENGLTVDIGDLVLDTRTYYTIKNNLTNCTSNNNTTEAVQGGSYSATITAKSGYELKSVTVTMGGSPVTVSGGVVNIASVTGNIVITAVAEENKVNYTNLADPTSSDWATGKRLNSSGGLTDKTGVISTNFIGPIKNGDIVVVNIPIDRDTGCCMIEYDILEMYHENIKNVFKDHQVIMSPLDISIISNENIDIEGDN